MCFRMLVKSRVYVDECDEESSNVVESECDEEAICVVCVVIKSH
jgi:hypothetical protein